MNKINYPKSSEILFLRGDINYTEFHLVDGKMIVSSFTLKKHEEYLEGFLRVSKKHLVNPDFVRKVAVEGAKAQVELNDGKRLTVSRRRIEYVKNIFFL
ncbi:LytR/AlgR family response regulator transcription factor [Lacihabitans lacunae]|uniref:LytR/AlgR family response regulator transcription factor n=1 Tax=Lacihabitans lacunae TaxID=1028214 RepID=A0ABV7YVQ6_9BACT